MMDLLRSRWAAIGAAVAVTLGAGGLATVRADTAQSVFVAVTPRRVLDTRIGVGLPGALIGGTPRKLDVTGTVPVVSATGTATTGLVVPDGATAIVANVTALRSTSTGFVSVRPGTATGTPTTSNLNIAAAGGTYPNSVTVELAADGTIDLFYFANTPGGTTDLLLDIVGYYLAGSGTPGPQGLPGPTGPQGPTGATGARGVSAWDTIPSGQTVAGEIIWDYSAAATSSDRIGVSLPALAPVDLTATNVNFAADAFAVTIDDDASCAGTLAAPTAPPGKVCIYANNWGNLTNMAGFANLTLRKSGFFINASPPTTGIDTYLYATWAYTAP